MKARFADLRKEDRVTVSLDPAEPNRYEGDNAKQPAKRKKPYHGVSTEPAKAVATSVSRATTASDDVDHDAKTRGHIDTNDKGEPRIYSTAISVQARARFLLALSKWPCVKSAASICGHSILPFKRLRRLDAEFAALWDESIEAGRAEWEARAMNRAFKGVRGRPIIIGGKIVEYERVYSDRLAEMFLAAHDERYSPRVRHSGSVAHLHAHQHQLSPELEALLADSSGPERQAAPSRQAVIEARAIADGGAAAPRGLVDEVLAEIDGADTQSVVSKDAE